MNASEQSTTPVEKLARLTLLLATPAAPINPSAVIYRWTTPGSVEQRRVLRERLRRDSAHSLITREGYPDAQALAQRWMRG